MSTKFVLGTSRFAKHLTRLLVHTYSSEFEISLSFNPLRPNNDLSQTSHYNIKVLSFSEVMRIENMIIQVKFY